MGLTSASNTDYGLCNTLLSDYTQKRIPLSAKYEASQRGKFVFCSTFCFAVYKTVLFKNLVIYFIFSGLHHTQFVHHRLGKKVLEDLKASQSATGVTYSGKKMTNT